MIKIKTNEKGINDRILLPFAPTTCFAQCYEHAYVSPVPFDTPLGYHGRTRAAGKGDVSHVTVASCRFVQSLIT